MLDTVKQLLKDVSEQLGISESDLEKLLAANAEHTFDIELENGKKFKGYRVQHNNKNGPYKGGVRFHPNVDLDEVKALSILMSLKTAAAGLPLGGGKGGVAVNPRELSKDELEELSRKYVQKIHEHIGPDKDVPAPDVNTNATVIDWMVDEYEKLTGDKSHASFTGKSIANGGSLGRDAATGRGGVVALSEFFKLRRHGSKINYAVQGFGNVGQFFARVAAKEQPNWKLVAASDSSACLYSDEGLDAEKLAEYKNSGNRFSDYQDDAVKILGPEEIISRKVDVLVLAALEDAINGSNAKQVQAPCIVEMANGPINTKAYECLEDKNVQILPDVIANAGGVIVSYLEWEQNKSGEHWSEEKVNKKLVEYMRKAVKQMIDVADKQKIPLKKAALVIALKNLL